MVSSVSPYVLIISDLLESDDTARDVQEPKNLKKVYVRVSGAQCDGACATLQ